MMQIILDNAYIYNEESAKEALRGFGFDNADIETLKFLLCQTQLEEAEHRADVMEHEYNASIAMEEHYRNAMNEASYLIDDYLKAERITKAREKLENIQRILDEAI